MGHELRAPGRLHAGVPDGAHAPAPGRDRALRGGARDHQRLRPARHRQRGAAAGAGRRPGRHHAEAGGPRRRRHGHLDDRHRPPSATTSRPPSPRRPRRRAGRRPRVVVSLPDRASPTTSTGAKERINEAFAIYPNLPSYKAMLDKEGAEAAADIAFIGDEEAVAASIARLADAGATDFVAAIVGRRGGAGPGLRAAERDRPVLIARPDRGRPAAASPGARSAAQQRQLGVLELVEVGHGLEQVEDALNGPLRQRRRRPPGRLIRRTNTARSSTMKVGTPNTSSSPTACSWARRMSCTGAPDATSASTLSPGTPTRSSTDADDLGLRAGRALRRAGRRTARCGRRGTGRGTDRAPRRRPPAPAGPWPCRGRPRPACRPRGRGPGSTRRAGRSRPSRHRRPGPTARCSWALRAKGQR